MKQRSIKQEKDNFKPKFFASSSKPKNMESRKSDLWIQLIWIIPGLFFILLFSYYAIYIIFAQGFNANGALEGFILSIKNFQNVLYKSNEFPIALRNTLIYSVVAIPISLLIALITAKALSNILNRRIFSFLQSAFFLPYVTSSLAVAMAFSMIFSNNGTSLLNQFFRWIGTGSIDWAKPSNAIIVLIIYGVWGMLPFKIILFTAAFMKIDKRLYQAASIDGTPQWLQFWKISIPQIMLVIIYTITTGIIGGFKFMPFGLYPSYQSAVASQAQTAVYYIFNKTSQSAGAAGEAGAASIILMSIILVMTIFNRYLTKYLNKKFR
ncbi:carbohydrate ABC transporter permease [Mesoplasma melaleucae]|uniref:sn-glycerol-3-phosphate ABC transporter permease n=1 Tax=Mesoplasma melaleucae TaxID=81459 RepID=A0A2K8NVQ2_9MOLU|nr:sugar ABC transporter permease [Mesoplasma melaleucae]ATZ17626.1 sn-glycerol-3-phosphate ABC transporter permease [Mesoplasma melaleucae]